VPRIVVITGTSSGIGRATAIAFAKKGDVVVATMRDVARAGPLLAAASAEGLELEVLPLDVVDDESVAACIDEVVSHHGRVDVLVNNAGIGFSGTLEELSVEEFGRSLDVNFLGVVRTTKAVLPLMRAAGSGRLIAVSSISGVFGQPFNDAYCAAKFALEGLYEALHPVAATVGVQVSLVEAGPVQGEFRDRSAGVDGRNPSGPYAALWSRFYSITDGSYARAPTADVIAEVLVNVSEEPSPKLRYQTSRFVERLVALKLADLSGERVTALTSSWLA
jgi:NAD(P)-dependent dehydrogenase (short-subunit alcohol dehydrogenase family)